MIDLAKVTSEDFKPYLNQIFYVYPKNDNIVELELTKVLESSLFETEKGRPFSLIFKSSQEQIIAQQIYRFQHEKIGDFEIFIVPIGIDQDLMHYEAVFA